VDQTAFGIYLRALWATISILEMIDMNEMLHTARRIGSDGDVDLILALRSLKEERHVP
jgi:hypothetical protein